jgi:hypothetical protein
MNKPFKICDSSLITFTTGVSAQNLRELRQGLLNVPEGSIYHHFWGRFLHPQFDEPEFNNDFASWVQHSLHDRILAERLSVVNPVEYNDLEELRTHLIDLIEERIDESELMEWKTGESQFTFLDSQLLVIDTDTILNNPSDLLNKIDGLSEGSIFFHFIDARRRTADNIDDFSNWLLNCGENFRDLVSNIEALDPYFSSLKHLRRMLTAIIHTYLEQNTNGN